MGTILITDLRNVGLRDVATVGIKNASIGELMNSLEAVGVRVPGGFATTADAYWRFIGLHKLRPRLEQIIADLAPGHLGAVERAANLARNAILAHDLCEDLIWELHKFYDLLSIECCGEPRLAVRSSATAEGLPEESFAGQHTSFLNVCGKEEMVVAVHHCYASLFTEPAIEYRLRNGLETNEVALSVGVQEMVRSDLGAAGNVFTFDAKSGFPDIVLVSGAFGLGGSIARGSAIPDMWTVRSPASDGEVSTLIARELGSKKMQLVLETNSGGTRLVAVDALRRSQFCLTEGEMGKLVAWARAISRHYAAVVGHSKALDIEWAKDGLTGDLFILQARGATPGGWRVRLAPPSSMHQEQANPKY